MCGEMIEAEIHVDHIVPVKASSDPGFFRRDNVQFLHPGCHSRKTAQDKANGGTRNG